MKHQTNNRIEKILYKLILCYINNQFQPEVKNQDRIYGIFGVVGTPEGRKLAWERFKNNFASFKEKYKGYLFGKFIEMLKFFKNSISLTTFILS